MLPLEDQIIAGVRTPIADFGDTAQRDAIVFVHGNPGPSDDWETLAPAAAEFARVVAMDMPGYGRAERPPNFAYDPEGYAAHLDAILDARGVDGAHLVLHDFGGPWGLIWAALHPERVRSITLINTGVLLGYQGHKFSRIWETPLLGELFGMVGSPKRMKKAIDQDNPKPFPMTHIERMFSYADPQHRAAVLKLYRASKKLRGEAERVAEQLRPIDPPTLVLWGEGDVFVPVKYAHAQRDIFPRAEVHTIASAGHWPFVDEPEWVAGHLLSFLRKQAG